MTSFCRVLFKTMPMGVVHFDADGRVILANPAALSIFGTSMKGLDSFLRHRLELFCLREDGAKFPWSQQPAMLALRTGKPQPSVLMKVYDWQRNGHRWLSATATPLFAEDGKGSGAYAIFEDVTERKESEIGRQEECISRALRGSEEGFWDWSLRKNQMIYSQRWWNMLGYAEGEIDQEPDLWRSTIHPEDQPRVRQFLLEAIDGRADSFEIDLRLRHKQGHYVNVISRISVRRGAGGEATGISGTNVDITKRLQLEDELRRYQETLQSLNENLEQRVKERTEALEFAIREQEAFSYSVSHDLRAPLRHINSFSSILREDYGENLAPEAREYLERISTAASRMGSLIDHLLELSRVSRSPLKLEKVNLSQVALDILYLLQNTAPDRDVAFSVADDITVLGDAILLHQLLENLLGNSWKYTAGRGQARIEFGVRCDATEEVYFVRDDGVGFEMQYKERLFHPFERLHGSEYEGLGIGLATAQRIVTRHGGCIWAEGGVGEGATFFFTVPAPAENSIST